MIKEEIMIASSIAKPCHLHATIYKSKDIKPTKILHIIHGMTEHMGRYEDFAKELTDTGVLVVGFDLRGHGKNDGDLSCASFKEGGWNASIDDLHVFYEKMKEIYPNKPYYMLGFSLGSFLLREFLNQYPNDTLDGAIIMGTGYQPGLILTGLMKLVEKEIKKVGYDKTTDFIRDLSFGQYNKKFSPTLTPFDWLCSDQEEIKRYMEDSLCKKDISAGLFYDLLKSMKYTGSKNAYSNWNKKMPILVISGTEDPVGNMSKGIQTLEKEMRKHSFSHLQVILVENGRHDLLHEKENGASQKTIKAIKQFIAGDKNGS